MSKKAPKESPEKGKEADAIQEVLPKTGLVFSEKSMMIEILCKPKIMPIKSSALERLEELEREANETLAKGSRNEQQPPMQQQQYQQQQQQAAHAAQQQNQVQRPASATGRPASAKRRPQ